MSLVKRMEENRTRTFEYSLIGLPSLEELFKSCRSPNVADKVPVAVRRIGHDGIRLGRVKVLRCAITTLHNDKQKDGSWMLGGFVNLRGAKHLLRFSVTVFPNEGTIEGGYGLLTVTVPPSAKMP